MSYISKRCRFGNQFIRNIACSILASKHNLKISYCNENLFKKLGIKLFYGKNVYKNTKIITDDNYFDILKEREMYYNLRCDMNTFLQKEKIIRLIYIYLRKNKYDIINANPYKKYYNNNNYIFLHIRLTDAEKYYKPNIEVFIEIINKINNNSKIFIATDNFKHHIIKKLKEIYNNRLVFIKYDIITTLQIASTCKHVILSDGTFSAIIGYLSFFSKVYFKNWKNTSWHGEVFGIKGWIEY